MGAVADKATRDAISRRVQADIAARRHHFGTLLMPFFPIEPIESADYQKDASHGQARTV